MLTRIPPIFINTLAVLTLLIMICLTYAQGVTGSHFYDDFPFFEPLSQLSEAEDIRRFIVEGTGGPLGRPIVILSFLPQADSWPDNSIVIRQVNVLIHLINGGLLLAIGYKILRLLNQTTGQKAFWMAFSAAALWMVLPILASTSLITVQRCTSLSATFGLMGLWAFVAGYRWQMSRPKLALLIQGGGLGFGTLLALFTKESGAIFPIYALVIDAVLLQSLPAPVIARRLRNGVLWLLLFALLYYLSPWYRDWFAVDVFRGWSSFQRLMTQFVILWHYLYWTFLPQPTLFGPFHDNFQVVDGWLTPLLALLGFFVLTVLAFVIRKRSPWPLFALLWFFSGHLIESTVINLELVFEHRNYIAVYGFCLTLVALAWHLPGQLSRLGPVLIGLYGLLQWVVLLGVTSIWGSPMEAGEVWAQRRPQSARAILHLSDIYVAELGDPGYSLRVLDRATPFCERCADVQMQALLFACGQADEDEMTMRYQNLIQLMRYSRASIALLDSFYLVQEVIVNNTCPPINAPNARALVQALLSNPAYAAWQYRVHLLFHAAYFAKEMDDFGAAIAHLTEAEKLAPQVMPILQMQVHVLVMTQRYDEALAAINRRRSVKNRSHYMSHAELDKLAESVHKP